MISTKIGFGYNFFKCRLRLDSKKHYPIISEFYTTDLPSGRPGQRQGSKRVTRNIKLFKKNIKIAMLVSVQQRR